MIPNPIVKVLSTLSTHGVRYLLMGGQACVFYGAAEFSRDCDVVVLADRHPPGDDRDVDAERTLDRLAGLAGVVADDLGLDLRRTLGQGRRRLSA